VYAIFLMDLDGSNVVRLTAPGDARRPTWSADGTQIAFDRAGPEDGREIVVVSSTPPPAGTTTARTSIAAESLAGADAHWQGIPGCTITSTPGNDTLEGAGKNDVLCGLGGHDRVSGGGGRDHLRGLAGNDRLRGNPGDDRLVGGAGDDTLRGGGGFDICRQGTGSGAVVSCEA
jgi:Ca2+-binding RTX toxin-like protein